MKIGSVFVSHSAKEPDHSLTANIVVVLEEIGFDVWWDKEGLEGGDTFPVEILEAIIRQNFFIFLMSEHSINSKWCMRELIRATELGKEIIPLILESLPPERSPLELAGLQYVNIQSGLNEDTKAGILRALGVGRTLPISGDLTDPFAKDSSLIQALAEQIRYAKSFTDTLNLVLLLENIGKACCETDRARQILAGMRAEENWQNGKINYDLVHDYLLRSWRGP